MSAAEYKFTDGQLASYLDKVRAAWKAEQRPAIDGLLAAYDEYVELLGESEKKLLGLAYAHGYRTPENLVTRGKELREKIAGLKATLTTGQ